MSSVTASDRAAGGSQDGEHRANSDQDDADRPQDGDASRTTHFDRSRTAAQPAVMTITAAGSWVTTRQRCHSRSGLGLHAFSGRVGLLFGLGVLLVLLAAHSFLDAVAEILVDVAPIREGA
jgi:hypothetical protein